MSVRQPPRLRFGSAAPSVEAQDVFSRHTILVEADAEDVPCAGLLPILERVLPITFRFSKRHDATAAGEIAFEHLPRDRAVSEDAVASTFAVPVTSVPSGELRTTEVAVRFADSSEVPFPFRGRSLNSKVGTAPGLLSLQHNEQVLASTGMGPLWTISVKDGAKHLRSAFALPSIPAGGSLFDVLNGERFLELLPFLHWLRELCSSTELDGPPLRACFIFDDPNLHWPRYGCVNFEQIAAHAAKENYRVAFAMIPLDTWFTHKATAQVFRDNAERLSLLVHGNDHTKIELARSYSPARRVALLQQAIRRIERFEHNSGLQVARVMVPPHGACSEEMLADVPKYGFEAACISHGSLRAHNKTSPWTKCLGYSPSELIQGCPVLPRWSLTNSGENTVLLAAFLRQPIVLRAHHRDVKDGLDLLDGFARTINGLGNVIWSSMIDISRLNYSWRMDGNTLRVKPLGRRLNVRVPEEAKTLLIECVTGQNRDVWRAFAANGSPLEIRSEESVPLLVAGERSLTLEMVPPPTVACEGNGDALQVMPFLRRLLTEGRDRVIGAHG